MAGQSSRSPGSHWETAANSEAPLAFGSPETLGRGGDSGSEAWPPPCTLACTAAAQVRESLADLPQGAGGKSQMENPDLAHE